MHSGSDSDKTPESVPKTISATGSGSMTYGLVQMTRTQIPLPPSKIFTTPSLLDGMDAESEIELRIGGCELIQSAGISLQFPQSVLTTGQILFQRFYYSRSFIRQPFQLTGMACLYLASKIEGETRSLNDFINVYHHIRCPTSKPLLANDTVYIQIRRDIIRYESRILRDLGFCVHVDHPHKLLLAQIRRLTSMAKIGSNVKVKDDSIKSRLVQTALNYLNGALRTNVYVRFEPDVIVCACIYMSAKFNDAAPILNLLESWFSIFDIVQEDVEEISKVIMDLYDRPEVNFEKLEKKVHHFKKMHEEAKAVEGQSRA